jgi:hypothetical protein
MKKDGMGKIQEARFKIQEARFKIQEPRFKIVNNCLSGRQGPGI